MKDQKADETKRQENPEYAADCKRRIVEAMGLGVEDRVACEMASVRPSTFERWKAADPEFMDACDQAYKLATARLASSAYGRAMAGSERLTERVLGWRDPEKYGEGNKRASAGDKSLDNMTVGELVDLVAGLKAAQARAQAEEEKTIQGDFTEVPVDGAAS